jgi:hypothetical protein
MKLSKFEQLWGVEENHNKIGSKVNILKNLIPGLVVLTSQDVYHLFIGAFEGGSAYWCYLTRKGDAEVRKVTQDMNGEPLSERVLMAVKRGAEIEFHDMEEGKVTPQKLSLETIAQAEKHLLQKERHIIGQILSEQDDAITADAFFQACVLGSVVYG